MSQLSNFPHLAKYLSSLKSISGGTYKVLRSKPAKNAGKWVSMGPFRLATIPVTWGVWNEYSMCVYGSEFPIPGTSGGGNRDNHPVDFVSFSDIMNPGGFCDWASDIAGYKLSLPTDSQFEFVGQRNKDGMYTPWGNPFHRLQDWHSYEPDEQPEMNNFWQPVYTWTNLCGITVTAAMIGELCIDDRDSSTGCPGVRGFFSGESDLLLERTEMQAYFPDRSSGIIGFRLSAEAIGKPGFWKRVFGTR